MKKHAAIGTELSSEILADVHGGRYFPQFPGYNLPYLIGRGATEVGKAVGKAASAVGKAVGGAAKGAWDAITSLF